MSARGKEATLPAPDRNRKEPVLAAKKSSDGLARRPAPARVSPDKAAARPPLREALRGYFEKPWSELPDELQNYARRDLYPWWDFPTVPAGQRAKRRIDLANEVDARSQRTEANAIRKQLEEQLFSHLAAVRDIRRELDDLEKGIEPLTREERIYREVEARQAVGERNVFKEVGRAVGLSDRTVRNIVGRLRRERGLARTKRKPK